LFNPHAFLYSDGKMTDLGTLGGKESVAFGINDAGQIVGWADNANGYAHAFLYSFGNCSGVKM
jgi:probable HAF family extracellular repeat protein